MVIGDAAPIDWSPESDQGYEIARTELKERFAAWCADTGADVERDALEGPIHYKWSSLDGRLTHWTRNDLVEIYVGIYPAKVMVEEELGDVMAEARAFLTFLAETDLLVTATVSDGPASALIQGNVVCTVSSQFHAGGVSAQCTGPLSPPSWNSVQLLVSGVATCDLPAGWMTLPKVNKSTPNPSDGWSVSAVYNGNFQFLDLVQAEGGHGQVVGRTARRARISQRARISRS